MASSARAHGPSSAAGLSGPQRYAFTGYRWLLLGFLLAGCAQIFLAGLGVVSFGDHDVAGGTSAFDAHRALGSTLAGSRSLFCPRRAGDHAGLVEPPFGVLSRRAGWPR
jgi:hypothetical protein